MGCIKVAGAGHQLQGQAWTFPPWLVVSAALNPLAPVAGGAADRVELLIEKATILVEEGVRIMAVADPSLTAPVPASEHFQRLGWHCEILGLRDMWIMPIKGSFEQVGQLLVDQSCVWPFDPGYFQRSLFPQNSAADHHIEERVPQRWPHFDYQKDYVRPDYAINAITSKIKELPGRGCIHVMADAGMGKTVLADALVNGWAGTLLLDGRVLAYTILRGRPEDPGDFLEQIHFQSQKLGSAGRPLPALPNPHTQVSWTGVRAALRQLMKVAQTKGCGAVPLVMVIDGLDELSQEPLILSVLPNADDLPDKCFVVLLGGPAIRPAVQKGVEHLRGAGHCFRTVKLNRDNAEYREMLKDYVRGSLGDAAESVLENLLEKAQYSFLYVRFQRDLLQLIDRSLWVNSTLPVGDAVFPAYLERLGFEISGGPYQFAEIHEKVLGLIAAAHEPIGRTHLHDWLDSDENNPEAQHRLNLALDQLSTLIRKDLSRELTSDNILTLGHRELTRWFHETTHAHWSSVLRDSQRTILAHLKEPGWILRSSPDEDIQDQEGWQHRLHPLENYRLRHRPSHLMDVGDWTGAERALSDQDAVSLDNVLVSLRERQRSWQDLLSMLESRIAQFRRLIAHHGELHIAVHNVPLIVQRLGIYCVSQGHVFEKQQLAPLAVVPLDRAFEVLRAMNVASGSAEAAIGRFEHFLPIYMKAWHYLGCCFDQQMSHGEALRAYQRAADAIEQLIVRNGGLSCACEHQPYWCDLLADNYHLQAGILLRQLRLADAATASTRAETIAVELVQHWEKQNGGILGDPRRADSLACKLRMFANRLARMRYIEAARNMFTHAIDLQERYVAAWGERRSRNIAPDRIILLAQCYRERALILADPNGVSDLHRAQELLANLSDRFGGVGATCKAQPDVAFVLAETHRDLAIRLMFSQDFEAAETMIQKAIEILRSLVDDTGGLDDAVKLKPQVVYTLGECLGGLGDMHKRRAQSGVSNDAATYYREAKTLLEMLTIHVDRDGTIVDGQLHIGLARLQLTIGHYELVEQQFDNALHTLRPGIDLLRTLIADAGGLRTVLECYPDMADILHPLR